MIQTCENRVLTINGKVMVVNNNRLQFEVKGHQFPMYEILNGNNGMIFRSYVEQNVTVNWGDGTTEVFPMKPDGNLYSIAWAHDGGTGRVPSQNQMPKHVYADNYTGDRLITFEFQDISELESLEVRYIDIYGAVPVNINSATKLKALTLNQTRYITQFPNQLGKMTSLESITLKSISQQKFPKIPDGFFDLDLKTFSGTNVFDLSDPIESNLFKLNQWENLEVLALERCNITVLDSTFKEITNLLFLDINRNNFTLFPEEIEPLHNLETLRIGFDNAAQNISFIDFTDLEKLKEILFRGEMVLSEIPTKWKPLVQIDTINSVEMMASTIARADEFISQLYTLVTSEASIAPDGAPAPYPNRFRNIAWGYGTMAFSGAKIAPAGYVPGVSNGTPTTAGQKLYVLQNQYGHTITHA